MRRRLMAKGVGVRLRRSNGSEVLWGGSDGGDTAGDAQPPRAPLQTFNRAISKDENDIFKTLFEIVRATPRKTKRVVNV